MRLGGATDRLWGSGFARSVEADVHHGQTWNQNRICQKWFFWFERLNQQPCFFVAETIYRNRSLASFGLERFGDPLVVGEKPGVGDRMFAAVR